MTHSRRTLFAAALGLAGTLAFGAFGCGSNNSLGPSANAVSRVRTLNALSGASANVEIVQTATQQAIGPVTGLAFGTATDYSTIRAGNGINVQAVLGGATTSLTPAVGFDLSPHNNGNDDNSGTYTLAAVGFAGQADNTTGTPHLVRILDNFPNNVATNNIALRLVNLSPDAGSVSLYNNSGTPAVIQNFGGIDYSTSGTISGSGYHSLPVVLGQTLNLSVRNSAGTELATSLNLHALSLPDRGAYTIYVVGSVNPGGNRQQANLVITQDYVPGR